MQMKSNLTTMGIHVALNLYRYRHFYVNSCRQSIGIYFKWSKWFRVC